jgi:hypothetical protein
VTIAGLVEPVELGLIVRIERSAELGTPSCTRLEEGRMMSLERVRRPELPAGEAVAVR